MHIANVLSAYIIILRNLNSRSAVHIFEVHNMISHAFDALIDNSKYILEDVTY